MSQSFPNPILSANLYCSGRLDDALYRAVAPFWKRVRHDVQDGYVWVVRYARGGEHLKIRLHGPEDLRTRLQEELEESIESYLASLSGLPAAQRTIIRDQPPIDPEDQTDGEHPDRTLLWTRYRHSPVTLGAETFLNDEKFTARFTRCLGGACELMLDSPIFKEEGIPLQARQSLILKLAILACSAFGFDPDKRAEYLAYHRDWLVRFLLTKTDPAKADEAWMIEMLDGKVRNAGSAVETLAGVMEAQDNRGDQEAPSDANLSLRRALAELFDHVRGFRGNPEYDLDPYTRDHAFLPIFKVLHGFANQAGLAIPHEAYTYHLLLRSAERTRERAMSAPGVQA